MTPPKNSALSTQHSALRPAPRLEGVEISLIRQINALATPLSVNLGIGEPNLEPDETLREMARRAATTSWRYSPNAGALPLRKRVGEAFGVDPKSEVCITAGTEEGLFAIFQAFVGEGDEVLVPDPGFLSYPTLARLAGATVRTYALEPPSWTLDPDALQITKKTKLIVVNSPSNPLGAVVDEGALDAIAQRGCLVVADEVYREIWYDAPPPSMLGRGENVLVVGGMSKSHGMTGLRLGWILGSPALLAPIVTAHQYIATCASVFSQALAEAVLADAAWNASWLEQVRAQFRTQREAALYAIAHELEVELAPPAGAFYAFVPVPFCGTVDFAKSLATDAAVLVIPGVAFGKRGEGFVRISFAAGVETIGTGIERIGRYLRGRSR
jgi:aspartate aminotransferase